MRYSETQTFEAILGEMLAQVPETVDKREGSVIYDALAPAAMELAQVYLLLDVILDETFVDTASMEYLIRRAQEIGVEIRQATRAVIEAEITPASRRVEDGTRFNCGSVNFGVEACTSAGVYRLVCETAGTEGNLSSGTLLPIDSVGWIQTAEITRVLIPGEDMDTEDTLRARYLTYVRKQVFGGNIADYIDRVSGLDGVGGVKVTPVWDGLGTVKVRIIGADWSSPSQELLDQVQEAVDPAEHHGDGRGIAPIGHTVTVTGTRDVPVTVTTDVTFIEGDDWETMQSAVEEAVSAYLLELRQAWKDQDLTVVRISQIESRILDLPEVVDITGTAINGKEENLRLAEDSVPVLSEVAAP